jgi:threonine/homoserine/homoserine lactone efflux protein
VLPVTGTTLLSFLAIAAVVLLTPGPSLLLIASTSLALGRRQGLVAVAGTAAGLSLTLVLMVFGLGTVATRSGSWFGLLRWAGVAWLALLGLRYLWTASAANVAHPTGAGGFWAAAAVSTLNPSTTPFLLALLPQFVDTGRPALPQLAVLGLAFLVLAALIDTACALTAAALSARTSGGRTLWQRRLTGILLLVAAAMLALAGVG